MKRQTILIANPKGGSGKTTLSTNLAGWLASEGHAISLLDLDRQQSSARWLSMRPEHLPPIYPMGRHSGKPDWLVIDSPAGLRGKNLVHAVKLAGKILVPITPSLFDIQATQDFLAVLAEEKRVRSSRVHIGIVGMRMAARTRAAMLLEEFLEDLDLPVVAHLHETQQYVNAAFEGKTLFDMAPSRTELERENWAPLVSWLTEA
jgi:chromosome partitioning protein